MSIKGFLYVTLGVLEILLVQFWFQQSALKTVLVHPLPRRQSELSPMIKTDWFQLKMIQ